MLPNVKHSLRIALLAATILAAPAHAATIVQTFTNSQTVHIANPTTGLTIALLSGTAFNTTFQPFAGTGLTSAVYAITDSISGLLSGMGGWNLGLDDVVALNGTNFIGAGNNGGGSVGPVSLTASASRDILNSPVGSSAADVVGTSALLITHGPYSQPGIAWGQPFFVTAVDVTISTTQTLTYTYTGEGALYSPPAESVPEPLSFALLGVGMAGLGLTRRYSPTASRSRP